MTAELIAIPKKLLSISEYLCSEEKSQTKNEYVAGRLVAMAGSTLSHARVSTNILAILHNKLRGHPCEVFSSDVKVRPERFKSYRYPDVTVACQPKLADEKLATILNPTVIFEVLSESTSSIDLRDKLREYISIDSMLQYVVLSQDKALLHTYFRQSIEQPWILRFAAGLEESIDIPSLKLSIPMRDVYAGVELPPVELPATSA